MPRPSSKSKGKAQKKRKGDAEASVPLPCAAIYVPVEMRHDIEKWLESTYQLKLLAADTVDGKPKKVPEAQAERPASRGASTFAKCKSPGLEKQERESYKRAPVWARVQSSTPRRPTEVLSTRPLSPPKEPTPCKRLSNCYFDDDQSTGSSPVFTKEPGSEKKFTQGRCSPRKKKSAPPVHDDAVYRRLYGHAESRKKKEQERERKMAQEEARQVKRTASVRSRGSASSECFSRLYKCGMAQKKRQEQKAEVEKKKLLKAEEEKIRKDAVLSKLSAVCDIKKLSQEELDYRMTQVEDKKLTKDEIASMAKRLYRRPASRAGSQTRRKTAEEKECTFRPVIHSDDAPLTREEHNQRFEHLYKDSKRKERHREELASAFAIKEKKKILKDRLESDHRFRERVEEDPKVAEQYLESL